MLSTFVEIAVIAALTNIKNCLRRGGILTQSITSFITKNFLYGQVLLHGKDDVTLSWFTIMIYVSVKLTDDSVILILYHAVEKFDKR